MRNKYYLMRFTLFYVIIIGIFLSCDKKTKNELIFLDEFVINDSLVINNTLVGGLSGIDYSNGSYYFVVDDSRNPRFLKSKIEITQNKIKSVEFKEVLFLNDTPAAFFNENILDLESIFIDTETKEVNFVSEGSIAKGKSPSVFVTDSLGGFKYSYTIPDYFVANAVAKLKHNGAFEGSSKGVDNKGFWVAMESPLLSDGVEPTFTETSSPIRITYFDEIKKKATKQFAYQLEKITKPAKAKVNLNGLTAILEYEKNRFFVIERTYQSGYGTQGNIIRIFDATLDETTTNTLDLESLKETDFTALKKRLLFDFEDLKSELTEGIIDNIEGITFGPVLENGNQSLVLVSDNNFQAYGKQLNQLILLEIVTE